MKKVMIFLIIHEFDFTIFSEARNLIIGQCNNYIL